MHGVTFHKFKRITSICLYSFELCRATIQDAIAMTHLKQDFSTNSI